jgi:hypothetical protein
MFMRTISEEHFIATKALIQFEDGPLSLCIARGATLGDVSEKLHDICKWHRGGALSIDVRFGAANGSGSAATHPPVSPSNSQLSASMTMSR